MHKLVKGTSDSAPESAYMKFKDTEEIEIGQKRV